MGYFFARKRTEHEVGYGRRVETVERIQDSVASVTEELVAAREYVFGTGPFGGAPAKRIGRILDDLEGYSKGTTSGVRSGSIARPSPV